MHRLMARSWCLAMAGVLTLGAVRAYGQSEPEKVARGRAIAEVNCARCHAVGPTGDSPLKQAPAFRTLSAKYPLEDLAEPLAEGIVTAHKDMPIFVFSAEDIDAFLAYLDTINPPHVPPRK